MKILIAIFTQEKNIREFAKCIDYMEDSVRYSKKQHSKLSEFRFFYDFSREDGKIRDFIHNRYKTTKSHYSISHYPESGFPRNINEAMHHAIGMDYDYLVSINDDAFINQQFIDEGIIFLEENKEAGFVGGKQQEGGWLTPISMLEMPMPIDNIVEIKEFNRLWWEASACFYRVKAIEEVGEFDEFFHVSGFAADSEYLMRMKDKGWKSYRNERMRFFHIKGLSQAKYRIPTPALPDPIKDHAYSYIYLKWGVNPYIDTITGAKYKEPFNGKPCKVIDQNTLEIGGEIIKVS